MSELDRLNRAWASWQGAIDDGDTVAGDYAEFVSELQRLAATHDSHAKEPGAPASQDGLPARSTEDTDCVWCQGRGYLRWRALGEEDVTATCVCVLSHALATIEGHRDYDVDTGFVAAEIMRTIARAALVQEGPLSPILDR